MARLALVVWNEHEAEEHAARLRHHVKELFPEGIELSREEWDVLGHWPVAG